MPKKTLCDFAKEEIHLKFEGCMVTSKQQSLYELVDSLYFWINLLNYPKIKAVC